MVTTHAATHAGAHAATAHVVTTHAATHAGAHATTCATAAHCATTVATSSNKVADQIVEHFSTPTLGAHTTRVLTTAQNRAEHAAQATTLAATHTSPILLVQKFTKKLISVRNP